MKNYIEYAIGIVLIGAIIGLIMMKAPEKKYLDADRSPSKFMLGKVNSALYKLCGDDSSWRVVTDGTKFKPQFRSLSGEWKDTGETYESLSAAEEGIAFIKKKILRDLNTEWHEVKMNQ